LATHRAIVDTWAFLADNKDERLVQFSKFYTGFQRPDQRNWMGFHDGLSNMKSVERKSAIAIESAAPNSSEQWTTNGTYLAFMRISIDLAKWNKLTVQEQEILIGREKLSGCPIIGLDKNNKPVKDKRCPVPGTVEVIDKGNEVFREHPRYGSTNLQEGVTDNILLYSHVGSTRKAVGIPSWKKESFRIFRQGYEFLEPADTFPGFRVGLNFISFQNTPERITGSLKDWRRQDKYTQGVENHPRSMNEYLYVRAAGIYFVPPRKEGEEFPGSSIFLESNDEIPQLEKTKSFYRQDQP
jgi:deferrochelatase/peroxidase EfeB